MTQEKTERLYLYLARRDKTDVKVLTILNGPPRSGRVLDVSDLGLDPAIRLTVENVIHTNRMYWEAWIDPASSFKSLRETLYARGFRFLPYSSDPIVPATGAATRANTSGMAKKQVMMKKPT